MSLVSLLSLEIFNNLKDIMSNNLTNSVTTRLFTGCHINSEIRMHLNQSIQWKHVILIPSSERNLQEIHYRGKEYFGLYVESQKISLIDLTNIQQTIKDELKNYCPDFDPELIKVCIFPQVFIA